MTAFRISGPQQASPPPPGGTAAAAPPATPSIPAIPSGPAVGSADPAAAPDDFATLIGAMPEAFAYYGPDDRLVAYNDAYTRLYGDLSKLIRPGVSFSDVIMGVARCGLYAPEGEKMEAFLERRLRAHLSPDCVHEQRLHDGRWVHVHERRTPAGGVVGIWTDVTHLHRRQEVLNAALTNMSDGLSVLDSKLNLIAWNHKFETLLQYPAGFLREGMAIVEIYAFHAARGDYIGEEPVEAVETRMERLQARRAFTYLRQPQGGRIIEVRGNPTPSGGFVLSYTDVTARETALERTRRLAAHDSLTGLPNRMKFEEELRRAVAEAQAQGETFGVLFLDLDRFKEINDALGHGAGDAVLRVFAQRAAAGMRPGDTLARIGGDEFAVVARGLDGRARLAGVMEELLARARAPIMLEGRAFAISLSIGAAFYPHDTTRIENLLKFADIALYHAKGQGRNCWCFFRPDLERAAIDRLELSNELAQALRGRTLDLHFQPQYRLGKQIELAGFEALLRWPHPERGFIPPDLFLPIAERTGLMAEIDDFVIDLGLDYSRKLEALGAASGRVALNISPNRILERNFAENLVEKIGRRHIARDRIILEITESAMLDDPATAADVIRYLQAHGVLVAIDDFGTGYSSFDYLRRIPADHLKIDRSIIADLPTNERGEAVTRAIIDVGHALEMEVVAEGVETVNQSNALARLGCDILQGYLLGRPSPFDRLMGQSRK
jgi:diguanylate cyclase (GGDEF)-like protein